MHVIQGMDSERLRDRGPTQIAITTTGNRCVQIDPVSHKLAAELCRVIKIHELDLLTMLASPLLTLLVVIFLLLLHLVTTTASNNGKALLPRSVTNVIFNRQFSRWWQESHYRNDQR